jgi:hypothetical protein
LTHHLDGTQGARYPVKIMSKKEIIEELFRRCKAKGSLVFDNTLVRDVLRESGSSTNPYDMTKIDDLSKLPQRLIDEGCTIVHLGDGRHKFLKCLDIVYHKFESIDEKEIIEWPYRPSILNDFSVSESSVLSLVNNHRIIHDFLYQDFSAAPKMYNSERKNNIYFEYYIGEEKIKVENLQIEIDLTLEFNGYVTVFEGKNTPSASWLENCNILQLYYPFRYYYNLQAENKLLINKLSACYLIRRKHEGNSIVRLYNYTFTDPLNLSSVKLLKKRE